MRIPSPKRTSRPMHQGKGYGRRAIELLIESIKTSPNANVLWTSHLKEDGDAGGFYRELGLKCTGEIIQGGDYLMRIDFEAQGTCATWIRIVSGNITAGWRVNASLLQLERRLPTSRTVIESSERPTVAVDAS